jgi:hypothetical protein
MVQIKIQKRNKYEGSRYRAKPTWVLLLFAPALKWGIDAPVFVLILLYVYGVGWSINSANHFFMFLQNFKSKFNSYLGYLKIRFKF